MYQKTASTIAARLMTIGILGSLEACQSVPAESTGEVGQAVSNATAPPQQHQGTAINVVVPAGIATNIRFAAMPAAACDLHAPTSQVRNQIGSIATGRDGVARITVMPSATAVGSTTQTLDCVNAAGELASYAFNVSIGSAYVPPPLPASTVEWADASRLPADPSTWSASEVTAAALPPRPEDVNSKAYARWYEAATNPGRVLLNPTMVPIPGVATNYNQFYIGSRENGADPKYYLAFAGWVIPVFYPDLSNNINVHEPALQWVGIDSDQSDLIQDGVDAETWFDGTYEWWTYNAFVESLSDSADGAEIFVPDYDVWATDQLYVEVWTCVGDGNYSESTAGSGFACYWFENQATSPYSYTLTWLPINANDNSFIGDQVDFIIERRGDNPGSCSYGGGSDNGLMYHELPEIQNAAGDEPYVAMTELYAEGGDYTNVDAELLTIDGTSSTATMAYSWPYAADDETYIVWTAYGAQCCAACSGCGCEWTNP